MHFTLFHFPAACSRVTMNALEELGLEYDDVCVNLQENAQNSPSYLAVNPKGKVPALKIDDQLLTQNAMIIWTLHRMFGGARLIPENDGSPLEQHEFLADLCWCADTLHPIVRQIKNPIRFSTGELDGVRDDGIAKLAEACRKMSKRIGSGWWYGDRWSIIDTYICWALGTARNGGFPLEQFPTLLDHFNRVRERPSVERTLAREERAVAAENITGRTL